MKNENEEEDIAICNGKRVNIDYYKDIIRSIDFEDIRETLINGFVEQSDVDFGNYSYEQANERTLDFGFDFADEVERSIRSFIKGVIINNHVRYERKLSEYLSKTYPD